MSPAHTCPGCGETERLSGRALDDGIEVRCERCGATWLRGSARCRGCGGEESLTRPQLMTRHPRGTLLSIVGRRRLALCPRCDAEVLGSKAAASDAPVPEGYVSRFLSGLPEARPEPSPVPRRKPRPRTATTGIEAPAPPPASPRPTAPERPTVRQAIEHFLTAHPESDSLVMLLLGQHLGPSTRLHQLDDETARQVAVWVASTWSEDGPVAAVRAVAAHWREQGWTPVDLAQHLH